MTLLDFGMEVMTHPCAVAITVLDDAILALNLAVAAKIEKGEAVVSPGGQNLLPELAHGDFVVINVLVHAHRQLGGARHRRRDDQGRDVFRQQGGIQRAAGDRFRAGSIDRRAPGQQRGSTSHTHGFEEFSSRVHKGSPAVLTLAFRVWVSAPRARRSRLLVWQCDDIPARH